MRIALFTPISPVQSALVDHIEGLLPKLAERFDLTVVTDGSYRPSHRIFRATGEPHIPWMSCGEFERGSDGFDLVIYQLGDEPSIHGYMFDALHRHPGLIFLHDLVLQHAIMGLTLNRGDPDAYVAEMRYSYGDEGERLARTVMLGEGESLFMRYPLVERVLDSCLAVVGYNGYMCKRIHELRPALTVRHIPYHFHLPEGFPTDFDPFAFRRDLGLENVPVVASFGLFTSQKRLDVALRAFRRLLARHPDAVYLLVGEPSPYYSELKGKLTEGELANSVRLTGWLPQVEFVKYMLAVDIAVHLRYPHVGGTPYTPIRLLGLGVPTIISDIGPLVEIPSNAVVRIPLREGEEEATLLAAMDYLLMHDDVASALGENGLRYVAKHHDLSGIADEYVSIIREVATGGDAMLNRRRERRLVVAPASGDGLARIAGEALAEMGLLPGEADLYVSVAKAIHELTSDTGAGESPGR